MMSNKFSKKESLLSGTAIYFVGNVLTQLLSLLLLKYITGAVSTEEYGYFGLVVTIDNLITPMLTLQIADAAFRFMIKATNHEEQARYYTVGSIIIACGAVAVCLIVIVSTKIIDIRYPLLVALYVVSTNIFGYNQKIIRALGKNKHYVIVNLIKTALYLLLQAFFVLQRDMGVKGLFLSNIISTFACVIILNITVKTYSYFSFHLFSRETLKKMTLFSAPLIPNTAIWWLQSQGNTVVVSAFLGMDVNGVFTIANKFSAILVLVISVFSLAWQESAIKEYGTEDYNHFVSESFRDYLYLLMSGIIVLVPLMYLLMPCFIDKNYWGAMDYAPALLISTALSAFSGFFASVITAKGQTKRLLTSNVLGAVTNIIIVLAFIKPLGIWAVVISSIVTNVVLDISRYSAVADVVDIKEVELRNILLITVACVSAFVLYYTRLTVPNIVMTVVSVAIALTLNKNFIFDVIYMLKGRLKKHE